MKTTIIKIKLLEKTINLLNGNLSLVEIVKEESKDKKKKKKYK
jgi:hypothetical protein